MKKKPIPHQPSLFGFQRPIKRLKITEAEKTAARLAMAKNDQVGALRVLGEILGKIEERL